MGPGRGSFTMQAPCCIDRPLGRRGVGWYGGEAPPPCRGTPLAVQSECCSAPSHPQAAAPGDQLGRVRRQSARSRQPDRVVTPEAVAAWAAVPRLGRGGQSTYSNLANTTALTLRAVFRLALRQAEGQIGSVLQLLGLDLAVPDHSTLSRRAATLEVPRPQAGRAPV